ncbi:MAG: hypothetical protein J6U59_05045 [Alistipes sp.]|nr:hypothetical protein [Alistipes sp.]
MKKILSLMIAVVALFACQELSAQKNSIVGKWQANTEQLGLLEALGLAGEDDVDADVVVVLDIKRNATGKFIVDANVGGPVEDGTDMVMKMGMVLDINWTFENDIFAVDYTGAQVTIKEMRVVPADPEFDAFFAQLKPMMEQKMSQELLESTNDNDDVRVEFVDKDNVIFHDFVDGATVTFTRVK